MRRLRGSQLAIVAFGAAPTVMRRRNALELETPDATATPLYAYATHDQSEISLSPTAPADDQCDLLVMGGYGHPRISEMIFGGVSREILR